MTDAPIPVPPTEYDNLIASYRSGQVSEKQWTEHLRDQTFASYYMGAQRAATRGPLSTNRPSRASEPGCLQG